MRHSKSFKIYSNSPHAEIFFMTFKKRKKRKKKAKDIIQYFGVNAIRGEVNLAIYVKQQNKSVVEFVITLAVFTTYQHKIGMIHALLYRYKE